MIKVEKGVIFGEMVPNWAVEGSMDGEGEEVSARGKQSDDELGRIDRENKNEYC
jgi:hypothetical protein